MYSVWGEQSSWFPLEWMESEVADNIVKLCHCRIVFGRYIVIYSIAAFQVPKGGV